MIATWNMDRESTLVLLCNFRVTDIAWVIASVDVHGSHTTQLTDNRDDGVITVEKTGKHFNITYADGEEANG